VPPLFFPAASFAIEDKQGKREPLTGTLNGGDVCKIVLSGRNAQLSKKVVSFNW